MNFDLDPLEELDYAFDFAATTNAAFNGGSVEEDYLDPTEIITSATVTVPTGITLVSSAIVESGKTVQIVLSSCILGDAYSIDCSAITDTLIAIGTFRTINRKMIMNCIDK